MYPHIDQSLDTNCLREKSVTQDEVAPSAKCKSLQGTQLWVVKSQQLWAAEEGALQS